MTKETIGGVMSEEIKLCPFCGGEAELREYPLAEWWRVTCVDCDAQSGEFYYSENDIKENAIKAWNKRPDNWISIKERLPKVEQIVLWWNSDVGMVEFGSSYSFNGENVTHWMPLPGPPTNQAQGT